MVANGCEWLRMEWCFANGFKINNYYLFADSRNSMNLLMESNGTSCEWNCAMLSRLTNN